MAIASHSEHETDWLSGVRAAFAAAARGVHASNLTRQRQASKAEFVRIVRSTLERRRERGRGSWGHS